MPIIQNLPMFNNVALDVFIGLIFVFLLYSLLATIVMEFIAHYMSLRARLLVKAMRRMLEDNPREIFGTKKGWTVLDVFSDFFESIKRYFYPFKNLPFLARFYSHPTIKYLGESKSSSKPAYMQANNFSQTLIQILRGVDYKPGQDQMTAIENFLFIQAPEITRKYNENKHWILHLPKLQKILKADHTPEEIAIKLEKKAKSILRRPERILLRSLAAEIRKYKDVVAIKEHMNELHPIVTELPKKISPETLKHLQNIFTDAQYKFEGFRANLEVWFNGTMDRASGWYKRQTQVILLCLGLVIAIVANVNTVEIHKILSRDKKTRDQMVTLALENKDKYADATTHIRNKVNDTASSARSLAAPTFNAADTSLTRDSVLDRTYKMLQADMDNASYILGLGWCTSDSCKKYKQRLDSLRTLLEKEESNTNSTDSTEALKKQLKADINTARTAYKNFKNGWNGWSIIGWLITALAISLGAPFWFDLLSKITKIRSAGVKESPQTQTGSSTSPAVSINVNNATNPNSNEEAVG